MTIREPDPRTVLPVMRCDGCAQVRPVFEGPRKQFGNHDETHLCFACWAVLTRYAMAEAERILHEPEGPP